MLQALNIKLIRVFSALLTTQIAFTLQAEFSRSHTDEYQLSPTGFLLHMMLL